MRLTQKNQQLQLLEGWVENHKIFRFFMSHTALAFFYGIFLFSYDIICIEERVTALHPILIMWSATLFLYDVFIRRLWERIPFWKPVALFCVSAVITALLTVNASGIVASVKGLILTSLPLVAFYPVCLSDSPQKQNKAMITALLGAAVVLFIASSISLVLYMLRVSIPIEYKGAIEHMGICLYDELNPETGIILYGVYRETNHAAVFAVIFAFYSIALFSACQKGIYPKKWQNVLGGVFATVNFIVQICYFPLANSRGGWLSIVAALFITGFFYFFFYKLFQSKMFLRILLSLVGTTVCMALVCGGIIGLRNSLSHMSITIHQISTVTAPVETPSVQEILPKDSATVDSFDKESSGGFGTRPAIWRETLALYTMRPIFGENPGNSVYYAENFFEEGESIHMVNGAAVHNSYLDLLLDYGAIGFILLMGFFVLCGCSVLKKLGNGTSFNVSFYCAIGGVVMVASASFLISCIFINTTAMYYALLCMISYLMAYTHQEVSEV